MFIRSAFFRSTKILAATYLVASTAMFGQETQLPAPPVIRTETRLVLVDAVVTDKKGQYLPDLTLKDFKVWEDNKEQKLTTFSFGADPAAPADNQRRYIVLFFDNASTNFTEQAQARQAAAKFIESNAGADRVMAVANFGGSLQISQNFTGDIDKLKAAVSGVKSSSVTTAREPGVRGLGGSGIASFGANNMLYALRDMAKNLGEIPGRKSLILFTSGFPMTTDVRSWANATIDACNKANVAIYPIDVRGLSTNAPGLDIMTSPTGGRRGGGAALREPAGLLPGMLNRSGVALAAFPVMRIASFFQRGGTTGGSTGGSTGGGTGGGGGTTGGGTTGGGGAGGARTGGAGGVTGGSPSGGMTGRPTGTAPGTSPGNNNGNTGARNPNNPNNTNNNGGFNNNNPNNPNNNNNRNVFNTPRMNMPDMLSSASNNQQIMYLLAENTGGFVIVNTNDLLGGMQKIGKEQNQYYVVGYTPAESAEGTCHTLRLKVDRGGTTVRSRAGYCNVKSKDALAGSPVEKTLESRATGSTAGTIAASMRAPFFYTGANTARVAVAMEIPTATLKFEKVKGKQHSTINVLGIAYKQDGTVAARFSDAVKLDFESQKEVQAFKDKPLHYENQFDIGSGSYNLKVVFDSGSDAFGKISAPLVINAYDGKDFAVSAAAFSQQFGKTSETDSSMDSLLLEGRAPLVAGAYQFTPTGVSRFKSAEKVAVYAEVYDPLYGVEPKPGDSKLSLVVSMRFLDAATNEVKQDTGAVAVDNFIHPGSPVVPIGLRLPLETLKPGTYRMELKAMDSAGNFAIRTADFEIL